MGRLVACYVTFGTSYGTLIVACSILPAKCDMYIVNHVKCYLNVSQAPIKYVTHVTRDARPIHKM